jgi:hypothetical protein
MPSAERIFIFMHALEKLDPKVDVGAVADELLWEVVKKTDRPIGLKVGPFSLASRADEPAADDLKDWALAGVFSSFTVRLYSDWRGGMLRIDQGEELNVRTYSNVNGELKGVKDERFTLFPGEKPRFFKPGEGFKGIDFVYTDGKGTFYLVKMTKGKEHTLPWRFIDDLLVHIDAQYTVMLLWLRPISRSLDSSLEWAPLVPKLTEGEDRPWRIPEENELVAIWDVELSAPCEILEQIVPCAGELGQLAQRILERVGTQAVPMDTDMDPTDTRVVPVDTRAIAGGERPKGEEEDLGVLLDWGD